MKELLDLKVRWFNIRGLGIKQRDQKYDTYSKIVAYLRISPFTFEQLCKVSGIHRNTLRNRLNELIKHKVILKHKYLNNIDSVTIKRKIYGKLPINPFYSFPPMFKRNYYILNYDRLRIFECYEKGIDPNNNKPNTINGMKGGDLIEKYYSNSRTNQVCELDTIIANSPQLSDISNEIKKLSAYSKQQQLKKMDNIKRFYFSLYYILRSTAYLRELDLIAIKEKLHLNFALPLDESLEGLDIFESYVEYFSNLGMTNADILIRCSTEVTLLNISNPMKILPMTDYLDLLDYFFNTARKLP